MSDSFEYLERRRMFAAYPTQPLVIPCTDGPDTISIAQSGDFLQVRNNRVLSFHRWKGYFIPGPTPNSPPIAVPGISKVVVNAGWGDDVLNVDTTVTIPIEARGQHGDDSLVGGMNNDTLYGGDSNSSNDFGDDTLVGRDGNDTLRAAYVGNGHINAGNGNDTIVAGNGRDSVYAGDGNDVIWGDDVTELENEGAADTLNGEGGNDTIHSGEGPDNVDGGAGNDLLFNSIRNDNFVGGTGTDTITYETSTRGVTILMGQGESGAPFEHDFISSDIETAIGSPFADTIVGSSASEHLWGRGGNDCIRGMGGNDTLAGEGGEDSLNGGAGNDSLYGGDGADTLITLGGGLTDVAFGNGGDDSFWLDSELSEMSDVTSVELSGQRMHRISGFYGGVSREINGQRIADPSYQFENNAAGYSAIWDHPLFNPDAPISNHDVRQALVGDCAFLSGLGSIAQKKPWRIKDAVADLGDGTYAIRYHWLDGSEFYMRVDNDLPVTTLGSESLAYAQFAPSGCMWTAILEKAEATVEGGYAELDGMDMSTVYRRLGSGTSTFDHWTSDDEDMMSEMASYLAQGKMISAATEDWGDFHYGDFLVSNHAYAVIGVNTSSGLIGLYNPWGTDAGGIDNGGWTQGADDGVIWIDYHTFNEYFRNTCVAS